MDEVQLIGQQDEEIEAFMLGDDVIFSNDMDHLIFSQEPDDKERLKLILIKAVANDDYGVINTLLNKGYQLDVLNEKNQTITHLAYCNNNHPTISWNRELVFSNGDNYKNYVDCNGLSLLHIACATDHVDVVKKFLDNGEDIHERLTIDYERDRSGYTPLHFAVAYHRIKVVKLLLELGANVNAADASGSSPVHLACALSWNFNKCKSRVNLNEDPLWTAEWDTFRLLIDQNCNLSLRDNDGNTPLLRIFKNNYLCFNPVKTSEVELKDNRGGQARYPHQERQFMKFRMLLEHGTDITTKNHNHESILHRVIEDLTSSRFSGLPFGKFSFDGYYAQLVDILLEAKKGIDINAKNLKGETPIVLAVSLLSYDIVKILLDHNADLSGIKIDENKFFRYPNTLLSEDLIFNLRKIISTLISEGMEFTLKDNLIIMKFLAHDVEFCDCGVGSPNECCTSLEKLLMVTSQVIYCIPLAHAKQTVIKAYNSAHATIKQQLSIYIRLFIDFCKLISYPLDIEMETIDALNQIEDFEEYEVLIKECKEDIELMKTLKLNNSLSLYDVLKKSLDNSDSSMSCKLANGKLGSELLFKQPFSLLLILSHSTKLMVRSYIRSSAWKSYISLLIPSLPDLCHELILNYLDNVDILRLCEAALLE